MFAMPVSAPVPASAQIDEIITTAQRRAETLQDVPVAATVITTRELETLQIYDTLDVQSFVPNLNIGTNTGTTNAARIFLRGIGEDESRGAVEPAVATYVDGVYYGRLVGSLFDLVDLERLEVLRGPQGTLYGRNSNGGAIKITTVTPQPETSLSGRVTFGNSNRLDIKGVGNYALSDTTAIRVSGLYKSRDGFFDIQPRGTSTDRVEGVGDINTLAFRGALSQDIGDWNILIVGDYTDDDSDPIPSSIVPGLDADNDIFTVEPAPGTSCVPGDATAPAGPLQFTRPAGCFAGFSNETESRGISAAVTGNVSGHEFKSITSWRRLDDNLSSHIGFPYLQMTDQDQFSQELTLTSLNDGPFNYVAGVFYFEEDLVLDSAFVNSFSVSTDTKSWAVFGQGEFEITDRATLTGGLRYTDEQRGFSGMNLNSMLSNSADNDFSKVSYTGKLDYDVTDNLMIYGSYSTGFKGSGFSPDCFGATACFLPVREEEVATVELGFRSEVLDNRLQFNGTYFNSQYDDLQIAATVPGLGFTRFNVDETRTQGLEFDMRFRPTDRFRLTANLGLLDAEYTELTEAQAGGLTNASAGCPGTAALTGQDLIDCALDLDLKNAPEYRGNVAASYDHPFAGGDLTFSGDISFEGDSFNLVANSPRSAQTDVPTLMNARVAYAPHSGLWTVAVWAKNLTDEEYFRAGTATANAVYASEPLTWGIDIGFDFR